VGVSARLVRLPRPEAGEEHGVDWVVHHKCEVGLAMLAEGMPEAIDEIHFPVGMIGYTLPLGIPGEVRSSHPCPACDNYLRIWAEWIGPKLFIVGQ
jgi:hypothetical protein